MSALELYMQKCIELAKIAKERGDSPVGSILVYNDEIIGEGIEAGKSSGDVTQHAEILAIQDALQRGKSHLLHLSCLYTTHEPCIMCSYPIRHYKIPLIVYGLAVDHIGGHTSEFGVLTKETVPLWGVAPYVMRGILAEKIRNL